MKEAAGKPLPFRGGVGVGNVERQVTPPSEPSDKPHPKPFP
jgi:hypothetical protein